VYEALFHDRQFHGDYRSRSERGTKEFVVNPLGLIFNDPVVYLVATLWDYPDLRLLALHRFKNARLLKDGCRRPADFDLDTYLAEGAVEFPVNKNGGPIRLSIHMAADVAFHLRESPLGQKQKIGPEEDGFVRIDATVPDTSQLRWWLLGFGDQVEVLEPEHLRDEFAQIAQSLQDMYALP
jgi:predicted DNA-binding transcriptional regulator YafY